MAPSRKTPDPTAEPLDVLAALAEPTRRRLYDVVAAADSVLSREQAAVLAGVPAHQAKFHLDRLVEEGLLEVEFHKLTGREGPGSGRPSKCYRRAEREVAVSLPARQYDLLSRILANGVARSVATGESVVAASADVARSEGETFGALNRQKIADELELVSSVLAETGYEPRRESPEVVELRNCPFDKAAAEQTELVCGLNLEFVTGVCHGLGAGGVEAELRPSEGRCCVTVSAVDRRSVSKASARSGSSGDGDRTVGMGQ